MQFQVPQNIDLEDKIIGPLTLKQFLYLLVGGMLDYAWYTFFDPALFILLMIPTTLLALALAFAHVQDQPFPKFLGSLIIFVIRPKILVWGKSRKPKFIESSNAKKEKVIHPKYASESRIQKLAQIIDTQGWGGSQEQPKAGKAMLGAKAGQMAGKSQIPLKNKESFVEKMFHANEATGEKRIEKRPIIIQPRITQPQPKNLNPENGQLITEEELEKELGLGNRIKSHEEIRPSVNVGAASENQPIDILESSEHQTGSDRTKMVK